MIPLFPSFGAWHLKSCNLLFLLERNPRKVRDSSDNDTEIRKTSSYLFNRLRGFRCQAPKGLGVGPPS